MVTSLHWAARHGYHNVVVLLLCYGADLSILRFSCFSISSNVNIDIVTIQHMIWELLNCGVFLDEVYRRLHEKCHENSLKIVYDKI